MSHEYQAPFHKDRAGDLLDQRREPYLETRLHDNHYRVLSLFALVPEAGAVNRWEQTDGIWTIQTSDGDCNVNLTDDQLKVSSVSQGTRWQLTL